MRQCCCATMNMLKLLHPVCCGSVKLFCSVHGSTQLLILQQKYRRMSHVEYVDPNIELSKCRYENRPIRKLTSTPNPSLEACWFLVHNSLENLPSHNELESSCWRRLCAVYGLALVGGRYHGNDARRRPWGCLFAPEP